MKTSDLNDPRVIGNPEMDKELAGATIARLRVDPEVSSFRLDLTDGRVISLILHKTMKHGVLVSNYGLALFANEALYEKKKQELKDDLKEQVGSLMDSDDSEPDFGMSIADLSEADAVMGFMRRGDTHIRDISELPPEMLSKLVVALLSRMPKKDDTVN